MTQRDGRHAKGGDQVATDGRTDVPTDRRPPTEGAAAPSGETWNAGDVVVAYVAARSEAGLETDQRTRAILGKYARKLAQQGGWDRATVLDAVQRFATSKRHVRFFEEWVATVFNADSLAEHDKRKADEAEERRMTRGLNSFGDILRRAAAVPTREGKQWGPNALSEVKTR